MVNSRNRLLLAAALCSALAALLHLACIVWGAPLYRFLGAGEQMARMAEAGHWYPDVAALCIAGVLLIWSAYAASGAGLIRRLPLLRLVLCLITLIYLARGLGAVLIMPMFPGNSVLFWILTSAICLVIGLLHLLGLRQIWSRPVGA